MKTRASLLACITNYWLASGLKAEANAGVILKGVWSHAQEHFRDDELVLSEMHRGALWSAAEKGLLTPRQRAVTGGYVSIVTAFLKTTNAFVDAIGSAANDAFEKRIFGTLALKTAADEGSTLVTDHAYTSFSSALSLVRNVPRAAEKILKMVQRYHGILKKAESADLLVLQYVNNILSAVEMYRDEFYPKAVPLRNLADTRLTNGDDPYAWLSEITQSCAQATSRLDENKKEKETVETEEWILHGSLAGRESSRAFRTSSVEGRRVSTESESDRVILSGVSDPFRVVASHTMDNIKGLVSLAVLIQNRTKGPISMSWISFSVGGALAFLPGAAQLYSLGEMHPGEEMKICASLTVRRNQGSKGVIFVKVCFIDESTNDQVQQSCNPYCIPSSDVLLLKPPSKSAGVDVFRRRWDLMREDSKFQIHLRETQTIDDLIDILQRSSGCLRFVGRMRKASHVGLSIADSRRGDYIAMAVVAPEAHGFSGQGPCFVHAMIRSHSKSYCEAFRKEVRVWLSPTFRVIIEEEKLSPSQIAPMRPQDSYFITTDDPRTPYQRWRDAHRRRRTM